MKLKSIVPICVLTLLGFFLRIYRLGSQSFWIDEAFSINGVQAIIDKGVPVLDSGLFYAKSSILFHYMTALPILLFGIDEYSTRIVSVIFGTLMIPLVYVFAKRLGGEKVALFSAFAVTFMSIGIAWSRQARMYTMFQFLYVLSLYLFYRFAAEGRMKYGIFCAITTICAMLTLPLGYALPLVYLVFAAFTLDYKGLRQKIKTEKFREKLKKFAKNKLVIALGVLFLLVLIWNRKLLFIFRTDVNYSANYISYIMDAHMVLAYFAIAGLFLTKDWKKSLLLLSAILIPLYFVSFHEYKMHFRYIFCFLPLLIILFGYSADFLVQKFAGLSTRSRRSVIAIAAILVFASLAVSGGLSFLPKERYYLEDQTPMPDFKSAYAFVSEHMDDDSLIVSSYSPMAEIYLRMPDYTLDFSLTGYPNTSLKACANCTTDIYNDVPLIGTREQLGSVMDGTHGYIILDRFSARMIDDGLEKEILGLKLEFSKEDDPFSGIYVYSW